MKIMSRVARLILSVVMSVYVVLLVLCCLQNNPVFLGVTILSHISKKENYELCILAGFFIMTGKKSSSRLSGGCTIVITTGKKVLVVCLAGARSLLRPEKKVLVVCLAGARSLL
jgi:hypothetical protein